MHSDIKYIRQYLEFKGVDRTDPSAVCSHLIDLATQVAIEEGMDPEDFKAAVASAIDSRVVDGIPLRFELTQEEVP